MNLQCIILRISFFFFLSTQLFSQAPTFDTVAFYRHLKDENLLTERLVFGQKLRNVFHINQLAKDTLSLEIATTYLLLNLPDSCRSNLKCISAKPNFSENKNELFISDLIVSGDFESAEKNLHIINSKLFYNDVQDAVSILKREKNKVDTLGKNNSPIVMDFKSKYSHTPNYSPFLAGTFSAIVPGAGKWYIGNKKQAFTSFIANVLLGAQATESYIKSGVSSARFIVTSSLFGIFYVGNIWGSVLTAKKKKRDYLNEIDYEILDYYRDELVGLSR